MLIRESEYCRRRHAKALLDFLNQSLKMKNEHMN